jgi:hypothetical protein
LDTGFDDAAGNGRAGRLGVHAILAAFGFLIAAILWKPSPWYVCLHRAEVAEWQTQRIQNPPSERA